MEEEETRARRVSRFGHDGIMTRVMRMMGNNENDKELRIKSSFVVITWYEYVMMDMDMDMDGWMIITP